VRLVNHSTGRGRSWTLAFLLVFYAVQIVLWILLLFYVPALMRSLADAGTALPGLTRWVIGFSEFVRGNFVIVASVNVLGYVGLGVLVGYRGRERWLRILLGVLAALSLLQLVVVFLFTQLPNVKLP
jgi:type II secretory pathway component PulF